MDLATLIGIVLGFGLIIASILVSGSLGAFVDIPGLLIVAGGTVAATLIANKLASVIGAFAVAMQAFFDRVSDPGDITKSVQELAETARREELLALENVKVEDVFLAKGVRMAVDGVAPEVIRSTMTSELVAMKKRHEAGQKIFRFMGATAPAMGMIGTLIGLVQMLKNLSDPSSIGPAMAVALLTTFYGAVFAFLIFNPIADKLESRTASETLNMSMSIEGIEAIVRGDNNLILKEKLESYLAPRLRTKEGE